MLYAFSMETNLRESPVPLNWAARRLRVPIAWLRQEILAGRLPGLPAGRTILVHWPTIERLLAERARQAIEPSSGEKGGL